MLTRDNDRQDLILSEAETSLSQDIVQEAQLRIANRARLRAKHGKNHEALDRMVDEINEDKRRALSTAESDFSRERERAVQNPETLQDHVVYVLIHERESIVRTVVENVALMGQRKISSREIHAIIMNYCVWPQIAHSFPLTTMGGSEFWESNDQTGLFLKNACIKIYESIAWNVRMRLTHSYSDRRVAKEDASLVEEPLSISMFLHALFSGRITLPAGAVSLQHMVDIIVDRAQALFASKRFGETVRPDFSYIRDNVGFLLCEGLQVRIPPFYKSDTWDRVQIEASLDDLIASLLPPTPLYVEDQALNQAYERLSSDNSEILRADLDVHTKALPKRLKDLNEVMNQLKVHMQRLATEGKIHTVLESELFGPDRPIHEFHYQYLSAPYIFGRTQGYLRRRLSEQKVAKEVESLYSMLEFVQDMKGIAEIYFAKGASEKQKMEGQLLYSMAEVYTERLMDIAVRIEAHLSVGGMNIDALLPHLHTLAAFRSGSKSPLEFAEDLGDEIQMIEASHREANETPADRLSKEILKLTAGNVLKNLTRT